MKHWIINIGLVCIAFICTAQTNNIAVELLKETTPLHNNLQKHITTKKSIRANTRWYSYLESLDTNNVFNGGNTIIKNANLNSSTVWQDSTLQLGYTSAGTTTYAPVRNKGFAYTFDPAVNIYNNPSIYPNAMKISRNDDYSVDSMEIVCRYYRQPNKINVKDTLIFSVCYGTGANTTDMRGYYYTGTVASNHNTDTLRFINPLFKFTNSTCLGNTTVTYKKVLDQASSNDTTVDGFNVFTIPVGLNVPKGNIVGAFVMFRSGDTWLPNNTDSIYKFNRIRMYSFEETVGTYGTYFKNDYNCSYLFRNDTTGWGVRPIPSYAFTQGTYALEQHWVGYKVTSNPTIWTDAIDNISQSNIQIYPNPTTGIIYLSKLNKNSIVNMYNNTGQCMYSGNDLNSIIDCSTFAKGLYTIVITDGYKSTTKLVQLY